ncbi:hypothetical protein MNEG_8852 [Monoraphidium neglectum]|uniref:Uncharacterized protein n=1 Tax=Monoraphidium neglectum TaxID=145388 RepID=A0A0D2M6W2_9CHLO|nr:hypothetical protein MNEG_8852 [Monoraphidium neglectum]KIY99109.1 hypothetical protein MNEG_8852 [Monoraphidium neglectum]|eukprot:XP_013898129.1 hypothetical protein MNEG_8852 [Monoraphidium neglectum]
MTACLGGRDGDTKRDQDRGSGAAAVRPKAPPSDASGDGEAGRDTEEGSGPRSGVAVAPPAPLLPSLAPAPSDTASASASALDEPPLLFEFE